MLLSSCNNSLLLSIFPAVRRSLAFLLFSHLSFRIYVHACLRTMRTGWQEQDMIRRLRVEQQLRASALTGIIYFKFLLMCTHQQFSHAHYLSDTRKTPPIKNSSIENVSKHPKMIPETITKGSGMPAGMSAEGPEAHKGSQGTNKN